MALNEETLKTVEAEMARLHRAIDAHRRRVATDEHYAKYNHITGGPETGAIRRASLDLTRALSEMRRRPL